MSRPKWCYKQWQINERKRKKEANDKLVPTIIKDENGNIIKEVYLKLHSRLEAEQIYKKGDKWYIKWKK